MPKIVFLGECVLCLSSRAGRDASLVLTSFCGVILWLDAMLDTGMDGR